MLTTLVVVVWLGLADSINPVTLLVAAYLASGNAPRPRVASFAAGVFAIYLVGGLVLLLGPGELLHSALKGGHSRGFHIAELVIGAVVIVAAVVLWVRREAWARPRLPERAFRPGSALALGAAVTAIDLPTAFPYFAAIGTILSSGVSRAGQITLLLIFNVLYVLPLLLILGAHALMGDRFDAVLVRIRRFLDRSAGAVIVGLTLLAGIVLTVRGATGL